MSLSEELSANMSQPLGLIPSFAPRAKRLAAVSADAPRALGLVSFGVRLDLSANQLELLRDALLHLPEGCKTSFSASACPHFALVCRDYFSRTNQPVYRLYRNGRLLFTSTVRGEFLERFRTMLSLYVAANSRQRTFVRAAVVGWHDRAVLILGKSGSGRTTLLSELVAAGATYYSDQFALIDKQGRVHPYACPLRIHDGSRSTQRFVEEFGGVTGCDPLCVALLLVCRYRRGARWKPKRLTPAEARLQILQHAVAAPASGTPALQALEQIAAQATVVSGVRGEGAVLVEWLIAQLGQPQILAVDRKMQPRASRPNAVLPAKLNAAG